MSIKCINPGALTTVQDRGRYGHQSLGVTVSGAMDMVSYEQANWLVGNTQGEAVLEFTLFGGTLQFLDRTVIALTGADMSPMIGQRQVSMNCPVQVETGSFLCLSMAKWGCRCYLAVAGGIEVPLVMGSRSTTLKSNLGGMEGRALVSGDLLPTGRAELTYEEIRGRSWKGISSAREILLRVILGPQADYFTKKGIQTFCESVYTISTESDRMGYRLEGKEIESIRGTDIISEGTPLGAVQVPSGGKPIVLMADRQTTGGYAKIATVCSFDIPRLAQGKPGDRVRFHPVSLEEAQRLAAR